MSCPFTWFQNRLFCPHHILFREVNNLPIFNSDMSNKRLLKPGIHSQNNGEMVKVKRMAKKPMILKINQLILDLTRTILNLMSHVLHVLAWDKFLMKKGCQDKKK